MADPNSGGNQGQVAGRGVQGTGTDRDIPQGRVDRFWRQEQSESGRGGGGFPAGDAVAKRGQCPGAQLRVSESGGIEAEENRR